MKQIPAVLFEDSIPKKMDDLFEGKQGITDELLRRALNGDESKWFTDQGGFQQVLLASFQDTVSLIQEKYGNDPDSWKWGEYHQLYFAHPLSSASPVLKWLFNRENPVPVGGSQITVQAANYNAEGTVNHGASWRFVIDAADLGKGHHIVGPGQSGHVKSEWYKDQLDDWVNGTYHVTDIKKAEGKKTLVLVPGG